MGQRVRQKQKQTEVPTDPLESAESAGLRYVSDKSPGIRRMRRGTAFIYVDAGGERIRGKSELARIRALAIPPAYTDVWICPTLSGHIQATGRDARGRKQYRYHPKWRAVRDETKFTRMLAFSEALPRIRERVNRHLKRSGLPKDKVLAAVVRLLECTGIRVGNDEYARHNRSFGLTTLRNKHVAVNGAKLRFEFRGKSGIPHSVDLSDRRLARIVQHCQSLPGEELFQYLDEEGKRQTIGSADVNDYLREISGQEFTAKDFRTWSGTVLAALALSALGQARTPRESKRLLLEAIDQVAEQLGNTRAVCRKYYIHPTIIDAYSEGTLLERLDRHMNGQASQRASGLEPEEVALVGLLRSQLNRAS